MIFGRPHEQALTYIPSLHYIPCSFPELCPHVTRADNSCVQRENWYEWEHDTMKRSDVQAYRSSK